MPRLFTGLEIPPDAAAELARLRGGLDGARWIDPENFHVTLRFIGDIDGALAEDIAEALESVARPGFSLDIKGLDVFGGAKPRALIARIVPIPALVDLQAEHERLIRRAGASPDTRKFTPHVTLARLRGTSARAAADWLAASAGGPRMRLAATRFVLFSARAATGGGPYRVEATYPLA